MSFELLRIMLQTTCADGVLSENERIRLTQKAKELGVNEDDLNFLIDTEIQNANNRKNIKSGFISKEIVQNDASGFETSQNTSGFLTNSNSISNGEDTFTDIQLITEQGAMSQVFKAKYYGKWIILKQIKPEFAKKQSYIELFYKEFENAYHLDHPNIVRIISKGNNENGAYYFMEYIDGRTLNKLFTEKGLVSGKLIKKISIEILQALDYVHKKQIFHRDLKPENILITYKGDNVKIIDFGLAITDSFPDELQKVGTPKYASPEQKIKGSIADARSDIFSFGLILLEMLSGQIENLEIAKQRCSSLSNIINKCIQPEISARYSYCQDIIAEISKIEIPDIVYAEVPENYLIENDYKQNILEKKITPDNSPFQTIFSFFKISWEIWASKKIDSLLPSATKQENFSTISANENAYTMALKYLNNKIFDEINKEYFFLKNEFLVKADERFFLLTNYRIFLWNFNKSGFQIINFHNTSLKDSDAIVTEQIYAIFAGHKIWRSDWELILKTYNLRQWENLPELYQKLLNLKINDYSTELQKYQINFIPELYRKPTLFHTTSDAFINNTSQVLHSNLIIPFYNNRYVSHLAEIEKITPNIYLVFKQWIPLYDEFSFPDCLHNGIITNYRLFYFNEEKNSYSCILCSEIDSYNLSEGKVFTARRVDIKLKDNSLLRLKPQNETSFDPATLKRIQAMLAANFHLKINPTLKPLLSLDKDNTLAWWLSL